MPKQPYLEYLHCLECGYVLGPVVEYLGRTAMRFINSDGTNITAFRALFECPICKAEREFYSATTNSRKTLFPISQEQVDDNVLGDHWQIGQELIEKNGG